jgi:hypothetical protein
VSTEKLGLLSGPPVDDLDPECHGEGVMTQPSHLRCWFTTIVVGQPRVARNANANVANNAAKAKKNG